MKLMVQGLIPRDRYADIEENPSFRELEIYSNDFIEQTKTILLPYARKWGGDPLHAWSRMWEYPFAYEAIADRLKSSGRDPVRILDAGSGLTFFPYYLCHQHQNVEITCVDYDDLLPGLYQRINALLKSRVRFQRGGIDQIDAAADMYDVVYCLSVLEHTRNYPDIVMEFNRLLKPGGLLILTFDVSMNSRADIPIPEAKSLLADICRQFRPLDTDAVRAFAGFELRLINEIVTTSHVKTRWPERLPWVAPRLSGMLSALRRRTIPWPVMKQLSTACFTFAAKSKS